MLYFQIIVAVGLSMEKDTVYSSVMPKGLYPPACICRNGAVTVLVASSHSTSVPSCSNRKRRGTIVLSFTSRAGILVMLFPLFIYDCEERLGFVCVGKYTVQK